MFIVGFGLFRCFVVLMLVYEFIGVALIVYLLGFNLLLVGWGVWCCFGVVYCCFGLACFTCWVLGLFDVCALWVFCGLWLLVAFFNCFVLLNLCGLYCDVGCFGVLVCY